MKITEVESFPVYLPLETPVSFSTRTLEYRDHAITYVRTDEGHEGVGYSLGYEAADIVCQTVDRLLTPMVMDEDPRDTERLWRTMFDGTVQVGRKGIVLRALSTVDMALWDIKAKAAGEPLHKLLGGWAETVPAYASGGYYRDEKGTERLREEIQRYVRSGHDVVKMKVGRETLSEEVERVRAVRDEIGPDRTLLLDANNAWKTKSAAVKACHAFAEFDPYFIEEPVPPDSVELMAEVNRAIEYPVAAGELEFSRYGFAQLLSDGAIDIPQPDVTVVGGITEWLRVAHAFAFHDIPVAPHYNWNIHASLLGAVENGLWVEYFYRDMDVKVFDDIVVDPLEPDDSGMLALPQTAGHGVELDRDRMDEFRQEL